MCHSDCGGVECGIALADRTQGHVHGLHDEVPFVGGGVLDEEQAPDERLVVGVLFVDGELSQQREGRALDELVTTAWPLLDVAPGVL